MNADYRNTETVLAPQIHFI